VSEDPNRPDVDVRAPSDAQFAIVWSRFNKKVVTKLLDGALECFEERGAPSNSVYVVEVPGAWELPYATKKLAASGRFDAVVADLRMPLIRDAIVSYASLFRKSNGRGRTKWNLEAQIFVPDELRDIHEKVCFDRDAVIAHCDLAPRNPIVSTVGIGLRGAGFYWDDYKALIPKLKELIEAVLKRLDSYVTAENMSSPREAFRDMPEPPPTALEDPGQPPMSRG